MHVADDRVVLPWLMSGIFPPLSLYNRTKIRKSEDLVRVWAPRRPNESQNGPKDLPFLLTKVPRNGLKSILEEEVQEKV